MSLSLTTKTENIGSFFPEIRQIINLSQPGVLKAK